MFLVDPEMIFRTYAPSGKVVRRDVPRRVPATPATAAPHVGPSTAHTTLVSGTPWQRMALVSRKKSKKPHAPSVYEQGCASTLSTDFKHACLASVTEQRAWRSAKASLRLELAAALEDTRNDEAAAVAALQDQTTDGGDGFLDAWQPIFDEIAAVDGQQDTLCAKLAVDGRDAGDGVASTNGAGADAGACAWPAAVDTPRVVRAVAATQDGGDGLAAQVARARQLQDFVVRLPDELGDLALIDDEDG